MSVRRPVIASLSTTGGGALLVIVTFVFGFALYAVVSPSGISAPAAADAIANPPLLRAEPASHPNVEQTASLTSTKPLASPALSSDRGPRVRELQKALARSECYSGPISVIWSDASKDGMRGFVKTVNAELPVDRPDEALVALVESNDTAKCVRGRIIATGALQPSAPPAAVQEARVEINSPPPTPSRGAVAEPPADERTMLDRAWAPAGMLVPPKEKPASVATAVPNDTHPPVVELTADNGPVPADPDPTVRPSSSIHFEDSKVVPAVQPADPSTFVSTSDTETAAPQPAKTKKAKTAKRKPAKYDDMETSISKGFDTLQRSLSSMF